MSITASGDSAEIDLLGNSGIDFPVSVEISKPSHGNVITRFDGRSFLYRPDPGFRGTDTIRYKVCKESRCRNGKVLVEIIPDPTVCVPQYNPEDTTYITMESGPGKRSVALFTGDVYCSSNEQRILTAGIPGIVGLSISDSIRFTCNYSRSQKRAFLLSYINKDASLGDKKRMIKVSMLPGDSYCDSYFEVWNREDFIFLERDEFFVVNKSTFRSMIQSCEGDLDPSFFELSSTPNIGISPFENDSYKIFFKPYSFQGPARLFFRYRNLRGVTDEGYVKIILH